MNQIIEQYVATERARGVADDAIKASLLSSGWNVGDIDAALSAYAGNVVGGTTIPGARRDWTFMGMFTGRLNRWEYFVACVLFGVLMFAILFLASLGIAAMFGASDQTSAGMGAAITVVLFIVVVLASLPISLSLSVRRLHDIGLSGWFILLQFIPVVNFLMGLALLFWPGNPGVNQYGPPCVKRGLIDTLLNR